ncbi:M48 family metalloprotease [Hyphomonas sp.]|uniref:M48 family metalloprotease n=1 Tax=Hyphomonas sp. TaxID=87 RepID=UPI00391AF47F
MLRILRLIAVLTAIPFIGLGVALARFWGDAPADLGGLTPAGTALAGCAATLLAAPGTQACGDATPFGWMALASAGVLILSFGVVPLSRIVATVLGAHRSILSLGFWPYALAITVVVGLVSLVHVCIFGGAAYLGLQHWFAIESDLLLIATGAVLAGAAYAILRGLAVFFTRPKTYIAARPVTFYEYPRLGLLVRGIAKQLNSKMPDNVVIGLQPTFFATSSPVFTPYGKGPMTGRTLHLSLPLMCHFTEGELKAVIGHELGHFSGGDTTYSMRFAPVYMGLSAASEAFSAADRPLTRFLSMPAKLLIDDLVYAFSVAERRIGRAREHRADMSGAKVSSPEDIAYSLLKSSLLGSIWNEQMQTLVERGLKGRFSRNVVRNFSESVRLDVDRARIAPLLQYALGDSVPHPIDTHPPTEDRIEAFGLSLGEICSEDVLLHRFFTAPKVTDGLDNMIALEEDLTALQYHLYAELWPTDEDGDRSIDEIFLVLLIDFLALMVTIDGSVDDREIHAAETQAALLFGNFDRESFRERCRAPEQIPSLDKMTSFANKLLTETGIQNLKTALRAIATADGSVTPEEARLLDLLDTTLQPEPPQDAPA